MRFLYLACAFLLTSCASREEIAQQDNAYCASIGATSGSPNYAQCRLTMLRHHDEEAAKEAAQRQATGQALMAAGAAWSQAGDAPTAPAQPQFLPPQPNLIPPVVRCRSTPVMGGSIQTVCQ
jgi:hypothetical protein